MHGIAQRIQILCIFLNSKKLTVFQNVVSLPAEHFEKVKSNHGHRCFSSSVVYQKVTNSRQYKGSHKKLADKTTASVLLF